MVDANKVAASLLALIHLQDVIGNDPLIDELKYRLDENGSLSKSIGLHDDSTANLSFQNLKDRIPSLNGNPLLNMIDRSKQGCDTLSFLHSLEKNRTLSSIIRHSPFIEFLQKRSFMINDHLVLRSIYDAITDKMITTSFTVIKSIWGHKHGFMACTPLPAYSLCFSPDGSRVASASDDGLVKVWSSRTAFLESSLRMLSEVADVSFSPCGKYIAAGTRKGYVGLWVVQEKENMAISGVDCSYPFALASIISLKVPLVFVRFPPHTTKLDSSVVIKSRPGFDIEKYFPPFCLITATVKSCLQLWSVDSLLKCKGGLYFGDPIATLHSINSGKLNSLSISEMWMRSSVSAANWDPPYFLMAMGGGDRTLRVYRNSAKRASPAMSIPLLQSLFSSKGNEISSSKKEQIPKKQDKPHQDLFADSDAEDSQNENCDPYAAFQDPCIPSGFSETGVFLVKEIVNISKTAIREVLMSPCGKYVACGADGDAIIVAEINSSSTHRFHTPNMNIKASPTASSNHQKEPGQIVVSNVRPHPVKHMFDACVWLHDSRRLLVSDCQKKGADVIFRQDFTLFDVATGSVLTSLRGLANNRVFSLAPHPLRTDLLAACSYGGDIVVLKVSSCDELVTEGINSTTPVTDNFCLEEEGEDNELDNLGQSNRLQRWRKAMSPSSTLTSSKSHLIDPLFHRRLPSCGLPRECLSLAWNPNGASFVVVDNSGCLHFIGAENCGALAEFAPCAPPSQFLSSEHDGSRTPGELPYPVPPTPVAVGRAVELLNAQGRVYDVQPLGRGGVGGEILSMADLEGGEQKKGDTEVGFGALRNSTYGVCLDPSMRRQFLRQQQLLVRNNSFMNPNTDQTFNNNNASQSSSFTNPIVNINTTATTTNSSSCLPFILPPLLAESPSPIPPPSATISDAFDVFCLPPHERDVLMQSACTFSNLPVPSPCPSPVSTAPVSTFSTTRHLLLANQASSSLDPLLFRGFLDPFCIASRDFLQADAPNSPPSTFLPRGGPRQNGRPQGSVADAQMTLLRQRRLQEESEILSVERADPSSGSAAGRRRFDQTVMQIANEIVGSRGFARSFSRVGAALRNLGDGNEDSSDSSYKSEEDSHADSNEDDGDASMSSSSSGRSDRGNPPAENRRRRVGLSGITDEDRDIARGGGGTPEADRRRARRQQQTANSRSNVRTRQRLRANEDSSSEDNAPQAPSMRAERGIEIVRNGSRLSARPKKRLLSTSASRNYMIQSSSESEKSVKLSDSSKSSSDNNNKDSDVDFSALSSNEDDDKSDIFFDSSSSSNQQVRRPMKRTRRQSNSSSDNYLISSKSRWKGSIPRGAAVRNDLSDDEEDNPEQKRLKRIVNTQRLQSRHLNETEDPSQLAWFVPIELEDGDYLWHGQTIPQRQFPKLKEAVEKILHKQDASFRVFSLPWCPLDMQHVLTSNLNEMKRRNPDQADSSSCYLCSQSATNQWEEIFSNFDPPVTFVSASNCLDMSPAEKKAIQLQSDTAETKAAGIFLTSPTERSFCVDPWQVSGCSLVGPFRLRGLKGAASWFHPTCLVNTLEIAVVHKISLRNVRKSILKDCTATKCKVCTRPNYSYGCLTPSCGSAFHATCGSQRTPSAEYPQCANNKDVGKYLLAVARLVDEAHAARQRKEQPPCHLAARDIFTPLEAFDRDLHDCVVCGTCLHRELSGKSSNHAAFVAHLLGHHLDHPHHPRGWLLQGTRLQSRLSIPDSSPSPPPRSKQQKFAPPSPYCPQLGDRVIFFPSSFLQEDSLPPSYSFPLWRPSLLSANFVACTVVAMRYRRPGFRAACDNILNGSNSVSSPVDSENIEQLQVEETAVNAESIMSAQTTKVGVELTLRVRANPANLPPDGVSPTDDGFTFQVLFRPSDLVLEWIVLERDVIHALRFVENNIKNRVAEAPGSIEVLTLSNEMWARAQVLNANLQPAFKQPSDANIDVCALISGANKNHEQWGIELDSHAIKLKMDDYPLASVLEQSAIHAENRLELFNKGVDVIRQRGACVGWEALKVRWLQETLEGERLEELPPDFLHAWELLAIPASNSNDAVEEFTTRQISIHEKKMAIFLIAIMKKVGRLSVASRAFTYAEVEEGSASGVGSLQGEFAAAGAKCQWRLLGLPLGLEDVLERLLNGYYRRELAVIADVKLIHSNLVSLFSKVCGKNLSIQPNTDRNKELNSLINMSKSVLDMWEQCLSGDCEDVIDNDLWELITNIGNTSVDDIRKVDNQLLSDALNAGLNTDVHMDDVMVDNDLLNLLKFKDSIQRKSATMNSEDPEKEEINKNIKNDGSSDDQEISTANQKLSSDTYNEISEHRESSVLNSSHELNPRKRLTGIRSQVLSSDITRKPGALKETIKKSHENSVQKCDSTLTQIAKKADDEKEDEIIDNKSHNSNEINHNCESEASTRDVLLNNSDFTLHNEKETTATVKPTQLPKAKSKAQLKQKVHEIFDDETDSYLYPSSEEDENNYDDDDYSDGSERSKKRSITSKKSKAKAKAKKTSKKFAKTKAKLFQKRKRDESDSDSEESFDSSQSIILDQHQKPQRRILSASSPLKNLSRQNSSASPAKILLSRELKRHSNSQGTLLMAASEKNSHSEELQQKIMKEAQWLSDDDN